VTTTPTNLKKLFEEADAARQRVSGYSDEKRADLEAEGRAVIRGVTREQATVCCPWRYFSSSRLSWMRVNRGLVDSHQRISACHLLCCAGVDWHEVVRQHRRARDIAGETLAYISSWGFITPQLDPTENGIAHITAAKLIEKVIQSEQISDGLVVSEAAFQKCAMLITMRDCLLQASNDALNLGIVECDLSDLFIVSPQIIVDYLDKQKVIRGEA
jgi:hypothetical protein